MNDYRQFAVGQSLWRLHRQMYWVVAVPAFSQPVHIDSVELLGKLNSPAFDRPSAYLLVYSGSLYYNGSQLSYALDSTVIAGARRQPLNSVRVQKLNNQLSIVVPVNINAAGCHEAQLVFDVTTSDGHVRRYPARWYVALDTGVSKVQGEDACAGPQPRASGSPTKPR